MKKGDHSGLSDRPAFVEVLPAQEIGKLNWIIFGKAAA
jgi:hypothetical protein